MHIGNVHLACLWEKHKLSPTHQWSERYIIEWVGERNSCLQFRTPKVVCFREVTVLVLMPKLTLVIPWKVPVAAPHSEQIN